MKDRLRYLSFALVVVGGIFAIAYPILVVLWHDGFGWNPRQSEYDQMMVGIYATLGVFLILAARDPLANRSLIWFTVWSSVVHGGIMFVQAIVDESEHANLLGDIPALFLAAAVLGFLMPSRSREPVEPLPASSDRLHSSEH